MSDDDAPKLRPPYIERPPTVREQVLQKLARRLLSSADHAPPDDVLKLLQSIEIADRVRF